MKIIKYLVMVSVLTLLCGCSALTEKSDVVDTAKESRVPEGSQSVKVYDKYIPTMAIPKAHDFLKDRAEYGDETKVQESEKNPEELAGNEAGGTVYLEDGIILDVPYINQRKDFPNGCESVSAVMALQYFGVDITPYDFIENYLDMGRSIYIENGEYMACDPRQMFPGDPRKSTGWGCYPEVIKKAIDKMNLKNIRPVILKDTSLNTLCKEYIDNKIPVVFWATIDMYAPSEYITWRINDGSGRTHTWTSPFHCLLLVGYDDDNYYFNDPWRQKNKAYSKKDVEIAYSGLGREALVLEKIS